MVGAVAGGAVPVTVAVVAREQVVERVLEIAFGSRPYLHQRQSGRGVGREYIDQAVAAAGGESLDGPGEIDHRTSRGVDSEELGVHAS
jgi:hypothetical protein